MVSIDDATIEQKIQSIHATKAGFRQAKDRRNAFERVLRDYYDRLRTSQSPSQLKFRLKATPTLRSVAEKK